MKIVRTIAELRAALAVERRASRSVGFVPTMGALHEGHLSLVAAARAADDVVVASIFVNPTQFNESSDLAAYPRQEETDVALAEAAGVDLVFAPDEQELYPDGFSTAVRVTGPITETLEGAHRGSAHFDGVATIVAKLLIAVLPDRAYFGQKDAQQLLVVRRMVADLGIPSDIVACPTSRDPDGLARSSRNVRLSAADRERALAIPRALEAVARAVGEGSLATRDLLDLAERVLAEGDLDVEYVACVDPETFAAVENVGESVLCAIAARVGDVRLIDNALLGAGE
ncbi:MAG: pantoate--beta-alanine ligase [Leucobacter sp.]